MDSDLWQHHTVVHCSTVAEYSDNTDDVFHESYNIRFDAEALSISTTAVSWIGSGIWWVGFGCEKSHLCGNGRVHQW